jgi:acyl-CoA reductase-like NAD-dependent aldehyde dehydrogenase
LSAKVRIRANPRGSANARARADSRGLWIDAREVFTRTSEPVVSPWNGRRVGGVSVAGPGEVGRAVRGAVRAFPVLQEMPHHARAAALHAIADGIEAESRAFADGILRETGKPVRYARNEVDRAVLTFRLAAEETTRFHGDFLPLDLSSGNEGTAAIARRVPRGPVLAFTPFNFPLNLVAHKLGPAIAVGAPVVLKVPPKAPLTPLALAALVARTDLPAGSFQALHMPVPLAAALVTDDRLAVLSFTGSARVGWSLKAKAEKMKVILELGGNAGVIVHEDADLDRAAERVAIGAFAHAGQVCISVQRIFVHAPVAEAFTRKLLAAVRRVKVGDPSDPGTVVGPMIDRAERDRVAAWVDEAVAAGARVLAGGRKRGPTYAPTVLAGVRRNARIYREEVFGPVATLHAYRTFDEAIRAVEDSAYGLQAGVFTRDVGRAHEAWRRLTVGAVILNDVPTFRVDSYPYGGSKDSGLGREGVRSAMEEYTEPRVLVLKLAP